MTGSSARASIGTPPRGKFTEASGLSTGPVSTEPYRSQEFFEKENSRVFKRAWLVVGREEQLHEPGSYIVRDYEVTDASIVITRTKNKGIRAFHNVCSHRSNQVVLDVAGKAFRFVCRYHNWTYGNDGTLIGVPDEENFFGLNKAKCGLTQVAVDVWEGWIFINLAPRPEVGLKEFLGEAGEKFSKIPYPSADSSIKFVAKLRTNWKVIADAFAESYHIPAIHPGTIGSTFADDSNRFARPLSITGFGPHRSFSSYGNPSYETPMNAKVERLSYSRIATGNVLSAGDRASAAGILNHPYINPTKSGSWAADVLWLFPNFIIAFTPGGFWHYQFWPISHNETRWVAEYHLPKATDAWQRLQQEHFTARLGEIVLEDLGNTERTQKGLDSRAKDFMLLQDGELMIRHSLHHVQKWIDADSVVQALQS